MNQCSRGPTGLVMLGRDPVDKPRPFLGAPGLGLPSACSELSVVKACIGALQVALGKTHCSPRPCLSWGPSFSLDPRLGIYASDPPRVGLTSRSVDWVGLGWGPGTCTFVKAPGSSAIGPGLGFPGGASGKEPACQCRRCKRCGFYPGVGKIPRNRKWKPTPVFLPGEFHGQRSPAGCSPWGHKESDTTEGLNTFDNPD